MVSFPQVSPPEPFICLSSHSHVLHDQPIILLYFINRTRSGEEYRALSSSLCSFLHSSVTSSLLGPNILLNTLFSNTLSLRSSLNVSDQVSHPYKTTGKIIVLYIEVYKFSVITTEDVRHVLFSIYGHTGLFNFVHLLCAPRPMVA